MQASGGTAAIAPMPAFFTASLHPDSMCLFVFVFVCMYTDTCVCGYIGTHTRVSLSDFRRLAFNGRVCKLQKYNLYVNAISFFDEYFVIKLYLFHCYCSV